MNFRRICVKSLAKSTCRDYACRQVSYTATAGVNYMDLLRILIAILLPPLGVFLQEGIGKHFWINIVLTLFGYIPGIVHAVYIIAKK